MHTAQDGNRDYNLRHHAYDVATIRGMERPLLERGVPLMRMAADATAQQTAHVLNQRGISLGSANVVLLTGAGDNGGDGLFAAAQLANAGATVTAIAVGTSLHEAGLLALVHAGGKLLVLNPESHIPGASNGFGPGEAGERLEAAMDIARESDVVLDAMTGIGVKGALRGLAATVATEFCKSKSESDGTPDINGNDDENEKGPQSVEKPAHYPLVVAVDTPSGVGVDDGTLPGPYIPADATMMFGAMKPCAMLPPASFACGTVVLVDFDFELSGAVPAVHALDSIDRDASHCTASRFVRRPKNSDSKYSRGVVGLITGSSSYPGAALLSSQAALRSNVGMVRYIGPSQVSGAVVEAAPEIVVGKGRVQAWAVGSGVPDGDHAASNEPQREAIAALLAHYNREQYGDEADAMPPICVDAGALDLLPHRVPPQVILTPHTRELARLLRLHGENVSDNDIDSRPQFWATTAHHITGATILLKGAITVIAGSRTIPACATDDDVRGDDFTLISGNGPAWLSTAGSGDVLAGVLAGILAQQEDLTAHLGSAAVAYAAATAAHVHGAAAQISSGTSLCGWQEPTLFGQDEQNKEHGSGHPIIASDIIKSIPAAIGALLS